MQPPLFRPPVARTAWRFILVAVVGSLVVGCGSEEQRGSAADGADAATGDGGAVTDLEATEDSRGVELGRVDLAVPDAPRRSDAVEADAVADLGPVPTNGACLAAAPLTFVDGRATVTGDTRQLSDEFQGLSCKGTGDTSETTLAGPQAYYSFDSLAGQWYRITLASSFSCYAYVFTSGCVESQIEADCQSDGLSGETSTFISAGVPESFYFRAASAGEVRLAVDSTSAVNAGTFTLTVERITAPQNASCAAAPLLGFANGKATARGDIGPTLTPDEFPTVTCGTNKAFDGPQAYYRFNVAADKAYRITLTAETAMFLHAYVFGGGVGCGGAAIDAACASAGKFGDVLKQAVSGGATESFLFMPDTAGTYTLAVDTRSPTSYGGFSLEIDELTPAANATCAQAAQLGFAPGVTTMTIKASTATATNEHGPAIRCGGTTPFDGPQVYYALPVAWGKGYRVTLRPQFRAELYALRQSSCGAGTSLINADCSAVAGGGSWGPILAGDEGSLYLHPSAPGTYLIAVDSASNAARGDFELTVAEVDLPSNATCSSPELLTLDAAGEVSVSDTTGFVGDQYAGLQCGAGATLLNGPQLYYALQAKAARFYELTLTSTFFDAYLYLSTTGTCSQQALTVDCSSGGSSGAVLGPVSMASGVLYFSPASDGLIKLAVDSAMSPLADELGDFTLAIRERAPASNGSCASAAALTLVDQAANASGFTVRLADEFPGAIGCGGGVPFAAGQAYYRVDLTAGVDQLIGLKADFDARLYAFAAAAGGGCPAPAAIESACGPAGGGVALEVPRGSSGAVVLRPTSDGRHYVVVDGIDPTKDVGGFELALAPVPANQRCSAPQLLDLAANPATQSGDTTLGVANEFGSTISCGNVGGPWPGPQLYYRATLQAGTAYTITVKQGGWDPALYAFPASTACAAAEIELACASPIVADPANIRSSDNLGVGDETITVKPAATEDWIIVVDSFSSVAASGGGPFTLEITW